MRDKIKGALYGVAIGDALGAPLEFMSREQIARKHGRVTEMVGGGWLSVEPGEITDDTQMTLAVAEGIAEDPRDPIKEIGKRFINWIMSGPKDVGNTCSLSIRGAILHGHQEAPGEDEWFKASKYTSAINGGRSGGNGALMRTAYPGLYYNTLDEAIRITEKAAKMTHWDDLSTLACNLYTEMIYLLTKGGNKAQGKEVITHVIETNRLAMAYFILEAGEGLNPTGYVVDSFKCALHSIFKTDSFEEAIIDAANLGGDADTIAAITGGLAGAIYGYNEIPQRWIQALASETRAQLDRLIDTAAKNREGR